MKHLNKKDLSVEEQVLWNLVGELWDCSMNRDFQTIKKYIHQNYRGWDSNMLLPHDRKYVIQSIADPAIHLLEYKLDPIGISVYDHLVGIVNYRYSAQISDQMKNIRAIKGRCTEVYLHRNSKWMLIGVHGGSDPLKVISAAEIY